MRTGRLLLAAAVAWLLLAAPAFAQGDARTVGCERGDTGLAEPRTILFLVDRTNPYDEVDRQRLLDGTIAILNGLPAGERVVLTAMRSDPRDTARLFDDCIPVCAPPSFFRRVCDRTHELIARQRFQVRFAAQMRQLLDEPEEATNSAIVRSVVSQARSAPDLSMLIVFSDFVENDGSRKFWLLERPDIEPLVDELAAQNLVPDFGEVAVMGFGANKRLGSSQPLSLRQQTAIRVFWRSYFERAGARDVFLEDTFDPNWMLLLQ